MSVERRIALYGGTFDPVHIGHMTVARNLLDLFALDKLLFIPAHIAPHKRDKSVTPPFERYAMLALATADEERIFISTIELDAPEKPYTIETLTRFQSELGSETRLFFVMGADSWTEITTWREWERLLQLTDQVVVTRPGYKLESGHVTERIRARIVDLRGMDKEDVRLELGKDKVSKIYVTDAAEVDVSSTEIRDRVGRDMPQWDQMVPPPVAEFIRKYRLYRDNA